MTTTGPASVRALRVAAYAEGASYLVLLGGGVWRRAFDGPEITPALGLAHGIVFLGFLAVVLVARHPLGWDPARTAVVLAAAVVPGGGFVVGRDVGHDLARWGRRP